MIGHQDAVGRPSQLDASLAQNRSCEEGVRSGPKMSYNERTGGPKSAVRAGRRVNSKP